MLNKKQFKRKLRLSDGMYSLEEDIAMHACIWFNDTRYTKLNPTIKNALTFLRDTVDIADSMKSMENVAHEKVKNILQSECNRFFAIYRNKYMEATDLECPEVLNPGGYMILRTLVKKINDSGSSVSEYLLWFFDKVLQRSEKLSPSLKLVMSNSMFSSFVYEMREELSQRRKALTEQSERLFLIKLATELYDVTEDHELANTVIKWQKGHTTGNRLKEKILEVASRSGQDSIIKQLEKGPQLEAMLADSCPKENHDETGDTNDGQQSDNGQSHDGSVEAGT